MSSIDRATEAAGKAFSFSILAYTGVAIAVSLFKNYLFREYPEEEEKNEISQLPEEDEISQLPEEDRISQLPEEDRISQLPDKVLSSIISRLKLKEAVRTSILSRRWRHVYSIMPALSFPCLFMFGEVGHSPAWRNLYRDKYLKVVDHCLRLYPGRKIVSLQLSLCFVTEYTSKFEKWMQAIAKMGIEDLNLSFPDCGATIDHDANGDPKVVNKYSFPLELISEAAASLKHLRLFACNMVLTPNIQFNSLKTLSLQMVRLCSGECQSILSSCLNLEKFKIFHCELPPKLSVNSSHQLKILSIQLCPGAKRIDIHAANLVTFELRSSYLLTLFLSYVPKLEELVLYLRGKSTAPYVFCELAKDLPHLNSLWFLTLTDKLEYMDAGSNMFRNLRHLSLVCWHRFEFNLLNVTFILEACSLLETFHLGVCDQGRYRRSSSLRQICNTMWQAIRSKSNEDRVETTPICHKHLKVVKFGGFLGRQDQFEVALFILKSAVVLDQMVISNSFKYYTGDGFYNCHNDYPFTKSELELFNRKLQGQAVSSTAKVTIFNGHFYNRHVPML